MRGLLKGAKLLVALLSVLAVCSLPISAQNFKIDHFKIYNVQPQPINQFVYVNDQFVPQRSVMVETYIRHLNPVDKNFEGILYYNNHLSWYTIKTNQDPIRTVYVTNQFGDQILYIRNAVALLAPTEKMPNGPPKLLDHYLVYEVVDTAPTDAPVVLRDQFGVEENKARQARYFAVPIEKFHDGGYFPINYPDDHLVIYDIDPRQNQNFRVTNDQFGTKETITTYSEFLAVPTLKLGWN